jgi:hypothetical protein
MDQTASENQKVFRHIENAVKTQIWIAISTYVLGRDNEKTAENRIDSLHNFTDFEHTLFEKKFYRPLQKPITETKLLVGISN